jgi:hypothetical protein
MAKTPIGDILPYMNVPKYAIAKSNLQTYIYKQGLSGLQPYEKLVAGNFIGYLDSWYTVGNNLYFIFYKNLSDYNNFKNSYSVKYSDYKKIAFPSVPTWKNEGIDFGATSTNIQQIIDRDNKEAESLTSIISSSINKIILIGAIYLGITLIIKRNNGN